MTAYSSDRSTTLKDAQVEDLFTCLNDPNQAVRTGALRLLVRLSMSKSAWFRLAAEVEKQLNFYLQDGSEAQARFSLDELLDAAVRIPVSTLRRQVHEFLRQGSTEEIRQEAGWTLARARDQRALDDFLWPMVKKPDHPQSQEAAFWIAHFEHIYPIEPYLRLALRAPDAIVRFWLALAMLRQNQYAPVINFLTKYLEGKLDLPLLNGDPLYLARQVQECGYFPDDFFAILYILQGSEAQEEFEGVSTNQITKLRRLIHKEKERLDRLMPLVEALIDEIQPYSERVRQTPPAAPSPAASWEGSPSTLITTLYQQSEWNLDGLDEILPRLSSAQKTNLISAWLALLAKVTSPDVLTGTRPAMIGIGNAVMQLPDWFWQGFMPDLGQLYDIFSHLYPERTDLMEQLAWVASRAGIGHLAEEYFPLLLAMPDDEKPALLYLLEHAILLTKQDYGPIYGAGPSSKPGDFLPEIDHYIDYESAQAGDEGDGGVLHAPKPAGPRYVQGEVYDRTDPDNPQKMERVLLADRTHVLKVWIDELKAGTIAAPAPINLGELPDLPSWDFQVYFWEPNHAPKVQISTLTVYKDQLSDSPIGSCEFTFVPRTDLTEFQGRLAVVYQKNVLQMLFLQGRVVADLAAASETDQLQFKWAEVKGLRNLNQLQEFDLVFYNESDSVQGAGLMFFGGKVGLKHVSGLDEGIQDLTAALKEAGRPDSDPQKNIDLTLAILANHGRMLYDTILEQIGQENVSLLRLCEATRLQLVSAVRDVLPLELIYIYPAPDLDAKLCPNAQQAIRTGACFECDQLDEASMVRRVCPLGFLGLRCTIERHAIQTVDNASTLLEGADFNLRAGWSIGGKVINPLESSLCAASVVIKTANLQKFTTAIQTLYPNNFHFAQDKASWMESISKSAPSMLILLSHSLKEHGIPRLEIGETKLGKSEIKRAFSEVKDYRPVVLLIGCETADPDAPYQSFATDFAQAGAAITVLTLSLIHESRATKIAEILINQIHQSAQIRQTFSEALLQARRNAMLAGYAEALTLVADGDADWILDEEA